MEEGELPVVSMAGGKELVERKGKLPADLLQELEECPAQVVAMHDEPGQDIGDMIGVGEVQAHAGHGGGSGTGREQGDDIVTVDVLKETGNLPAQELTVNLLHGRQR